MAGCLFFVSFLSAVSSSHSRCSSVSLPAARFAASCSLLSELFEERSVTRQQSGKCSHTREQCMSKSNSEGAAPFDRVTLSTSHPSTAAAATSASDRRHPRRCPVIPISHGHAQIVPRCSSAILHRQHPWRHEWPSASKRLYTRSSDSQCAAGLSGVGSRRLANGLDAAVATPRAAPFLSCSTPPLD